MQENNLYILSLDPGIKNLAYCLLEYKKEDNKLFIKNWGTTELTQQNVRTMQKETIIKPLYDFLENTFSSINIDIILIENQPTKNPKMKNLQMLLYSFFTYKKYLLKQKISDVKFISPKGKLKICYSMDLENITGGNKYLKNKKISIAAVRKILENNQDLDEPYNLNFFEKYKKKDDLSDAFLQALYFVQNYKI